MDLKMANGTASYTIDEHHVLLQQTQIHGSDTDLLTILSIHTQTALARLKRAQSRMVYTSAQTKPTSFSPTCTKSKYQKILLTLILDFMPAPPVVRERLIVIIFSIASTVALFQQVLKG